MKRKLANLSSQDEISFEVLQEGKVQKSQLYYISSIPSSPQKRLCFNISQIPEDLLSEVFAYLSPLDIIMRVSLVSSTWYEATRRAPTWRVFDKSLFSAFPKLDISKLSNITALLQTLFVNNATSLRRGKLLSNFNANSHQSKDSEIQRILNQGISSMCPVQELYLPSKCQDLNNHEDLEKLLLACPYLSLLHGPRLENFRCFSLTNDGLRIISSRCRELKSLSIASHYNITDQGLLRTSQNFMQLQDINLDHCNKITCESVIFLLQNCKKLKSISALFCTSCIFMEGEILQLAASMASVEKLALEVHPVEGGDLSPLVAPSRSLKSLHVRGWDSMSTTSLPYLISHLKSLKSLTISCAGSPEIGHITLQHASLQHFSISRCKLLHTVKFNFPQLETFFAEAIQKIQSVSFLTPQLRTMRIRTSFLEKFNWKGIFSNSKSLEELDILDCLGFSELSIFSNSLKSLALNVCNDLVRLEVESPSLKSMSIDGCMQLQDLNAFAPSLTSCELFQAINSTFSELKNLSISSNSLTTLSLLRCIKLKSVNLHAERLTNLDLSASKQLECILLKCPTMSKLALCAPRVSSEDLERIAQECPKVELLNLLNMRSLQDDLLRRICNYWSSSLAVLSISGCPEVRSPELILPNLKGLNISNCNTFLSISLPTSAGLQKCIIKGCPLIENESLQEMYRHSLQSVRHLELMECSAIRELDLGFDQLQSLVLANCDSIEQLTISSKKLVSLNISACAALTNLNGTVTCAPLQNIVLRDCPLGDDTVENLNKLAPHLSRFSARGCQFQDPHFQQPRLQQISFEHCSKLSDPRFASCVDNLVCRFLDCQHLQSEAFSSMFPMQTKRILFFEMLRCAIRSFTMQSMVANVNFTQCPQLKSCTVKSQILSKCLISDCPVLENVTIQEPSKANCKISGCKMLQQHQIRIERIVASP